MDPDHVFVRPRKVLRSAQEIKVWEKSEAYTEYLGFVSAIGEAVKGKRIRDGGGCSSGDDDLQREGETTKKAIEVISRLGLWVEQIPPVEQQQRFGNKAFREWHKKLEEVREG